MPNSESLISPTATMMTNSTPSSRLNGVSTLARTMSRTARLVGSATWLDRPSARRASTSAWLRPETVVSGAIDPFCRPG